MKKKTKKTRQFQTGQFKAISSRRRHYAQQFDSLDGLDEVDWAVMPVRQWGGNEEVKEKRQAEFLVHDWCPWTAIEVIGVIDQGMETLVTAAIAGAAHQPRVEIHGDWYY